MELVIVAVLVFAAVAGGWWWGRKKAEAPTQPSQTTRTLDTSPPDQGDLVTEPGPVAPDATASSGPPASSPPPAPDPPGAQPADGATGEEPEDAVSADEAWLRGEGWEPSDSLVINDTEIPLEIRLVDGEVIERNNVTGEVVSITPVTTRRVKPVRLAAVKAPAQIPIVVAHGPVDFAGLAETDLIAAGGKFVPMVTGRGAGEVIVRMRDGEEREFAMPLDPFDWEERSGVSGLKTRMRKGHVTRVKVTPVNGERGRWSFTIPIAPAEAEPGDESAVTIRYTTPGGFRFPEVVVPLIAR